MLGSSSSRPRKNVSKTTRNSNAENRDELQCRGSLDKVLKWYRWIAVYPTLKKLVDGMGFVDFCSINAGNLDNRLIHALVERWWPSIHSFHFPCGELGFTPLDFVMLTGISFRRGREIPYDERYSKLEEAEKMFPGITSSDMRDMIEWKDITNIDWQPWAKSTKLRRPESLKDVNFYDGCDYLIPGVDDYMTYWRLVHPNPKIGCSIVKRTRNIWSVGRDQVRPNVILPPTTSLGTSSQVQDYGVQETGDPRDMGWFMDVVGLNDQHRRIPIPVMQVPYPCPSAYSTDELWHLNQGLRYVAYEDSRQYIDRTTELEEQLRQRDEIIRETSARLVEMSISYQTEPVVQCTYDESLARDQAEELNSILTRSNTRGKAKSKRKMASTPIIVEDVLEASENIHDDKEQYSNSKNWSSDDFVNLACAWGGSIRNVQFLEVSLKTLGADIIPVLERMTSANDTFYQTQGKPFKVGEAYKVLKACPKWSQIHHIGHPVRIVARKSNFNYSPGNSTNTDPETPTSGTPNIAISDDSIDVDAPLNSYGDKEEKEAKARRREELKLMKEAEFQRRREAELNQKRKFDDSHMLKVVTTDLGNLQPTQRRWMKKQIKEYSKKLKEQCPSDDDVSSDEE
ncbi:hypothetical protein GIB67_016547 [Kingdonia uniflora]|uniref:Aminotransferase-like plant mobile domain-containing protein n=1 Tax=Kingdonia uniflora TaxID=39325 RepID=A0A7J7NQ85_9MAGN|nr:hypothetical protein GIB67_016547 [Kingdonia uniflora]